MKLNFTCFVILISAIFSLKANAQIVKINEVMPVPAGGNTNSCIQSMFNTANATCGSEWVELYNPNPCSPVDISCYLIGSRTQTANSGTLRIPPGTIIPPLGFLTIGGAGSGATISLPTYFGTGFLNGPSGRWYLENTDGWIAIYSPSGVAIDGVYWTFDPNNAADLFSDPFFSTGPGVPSTTACGTPPPAPLPSALSMSAIISYAGQVPGLP